MPTLASSLKTRYQALVAPDNDVEFFRLLNEVNERLLFSGRWHWVREPLTLTVADDQVILPEGYHSIVGARINGHAVGVNWQESEWFEGGPGEFIPVDGASSFLVDQGLVAHSPYSDSASVTLDPTGADNRITFTAATVGSGGNDITVGIAIDAVTDRKQITVAEVAEDIVVTSGDKRVMIITADFGSGSETHSLSYNESAVGWTSGGTNSPSISGNWLILQDAIPHTIEKFTDGGFVNGFTAIQEVSPEQVIDWTPELTAVELTSATAAPALASEVIAAVNASPAASALVTASASGTVTGAVAAVTATPLTGGTDVISRTYKLTSSHDSITDVNVLARFSPGVVASDEDYVLCPVSSAVKQMLYAVVYEEANDTKLSEEYRAKALRELAEHEAAHRGIAKRVFKPAMFRPARRRSRHNFP